MAGSYPNLDAADLEARIRTYLNEVTPDFYSQADIWRWLSIAQKDIAQKTHCVRRILDTATVAATREVAVGAYKVFHVEYVPASGRPKMLMKIDPLRLGHYPVDETTYEPRYWYEFGSNIGIDPLDPDTAYNLRVYISDMPKMNVLSFETWTESGDPTGWTDGATDWTLGATAAHAGAGPTTLTYNTVLSASTNYTYTFTVSGVGAGGSVTAKAGTTAATAVTTNGVHTVNLTSSSGSPAVVLLGANTIVVDDLYIYKEVDFAAVGDQTELRSEWQHLLALYATYSGLMKDRKYGPAQMIESKYFNELAYTRQNIVEIVPDGRGWLKYE
jgi:hypothetical protein